jgi:hypothetical protein
MRRSSLVFLQLSLDITRYLLVFRHPKNPLYAPFFTSFLQSSLDITLFPLSKRHYRRSLRSASAFTRHKGAGILEPVALFNGAPGLFSLY